ncbi:MAG: hypothetical protein CO140_01180 [Candidatus Moranbacteria bacterium CG_4_9_14_3_um_filter_40_7]|nr:MAG: hypothetical protein COX31_03330 [Candidatus Moranbacteria bacterium CG23_combo_of_CG06-09_8_20_14_all_40_16]PIU80449.1 MAG: hypothetical protein COS71_03390 [Candidatus Moranbacteria bacterium CG06_land_8_20_14_3_00_40_12]PJA88009.1 MAG: hypothetical protein CO140_01180 [Candidatus Moranbacteria bacterium CG_4_9_14_3_um_filter_40_7]
MKKEKLGFICMGHGGKFFFLNKDTGKIITKDIEEGEYTVRRSTRLRRKFPLKQKVRQELMDTHNLLTQGI